MAEEISDRKLNRLLDLNKKLVLENDFRKRIELISSSIKEILKVDVCTIFMHDNNSKSLWSIYIDGISYLEVPDDRGIASEVYKTKKTIITNDARNDPNFNSEADKGSGYETKSILCMPIIGFGGRILGVIQLVNKIDGSGKFDSEDVNVLEYLMGHICAYLEIMVQPK